MTEVVYLPTAQGLMPIVTQINGRIYAIHSDHLNTPRRLSTPQGQVAWQWLLSGFGEASPTTGDAGYVADNSGATGPMPSYAPEVVFNLRYPGQQWDEETGLAYNVNRYYDKVSGRYIQADPIGLGGGWNRFGYVGGNPLSYTDPQGLCIGPLLGVCVAAFVEYPFLHSAVAFGTAMAWGFVNGEAAVVSAVPTTISRLTPVSRAIQEGVESGAFACIAKNPQLFRGGNTLTARLGVDVKVAADGLIYPLGKNGKAQGLSLNRDPLDPFIQKYGGAFPVNRLPDGLQTLQSGKPDHFVIAPAYPMNFENYQQLLNQIQLGTFNLIP